MLAASSIGNILAGKGVIRAGEGTNKVGQDIMSPHLLTNFEIQKYYQNEPNFNGVYSRNNLPKIKDGTYVIKRDEYKSIETHWIALYVNGNNITYFDSFGVEHIPKEIKKFIGNKNIKANINRMQASDSIMSGLYQFVFS